MAWTELKEPTMLKFERVGQEVLGYLVNVSKTTVKGKPANEYLVRDDKEGMVTFLGTYALDKRLMPHWPKIKGCRLWVKYKGEDSTIGTAENKMKNFMVNVDYEMRDAHIASAEPLTITDDDIPDFLR
jgi:hypothetical protein